MKKAIKLIADLAEQSTNERNTEMDEVRALTAEYRSLMTESLQKICAVLFGNGDPSHSVIARLERIEEAQTKSVEAQKKSSENVSKLVWVVVTTLVTQIVLALIRIL